MSDTDQPTDQVETLSLEQLSGEAPPPAEIRENEPQAPAAASEAGQDGAAAETEGAPSAPTEPFWYRKTLKEKDRQLKDRDRELEILRQRVGSPPDQRQPGPAAPSLPDPLDDPNGYQGGILQVVEERIARAAFDQRLALSEHTARQKHGDELTDEADAWLSTRPDVAEWAARQPSPWLAAIQTYQREKLASEIGDDPNAWREAERERLRQELLAEMTPANPGGNMNPRPVIPQPAATVRNAAPRSAWTGPAPLSEIGKNNFG